MQHGELAKWPAGVDAAGHTHGPFRAATFAARGPVGGCSFSHDARKKSMSRGWLAAGRNALGGKAHRPQAKHRVANDFYELIK